MQNKKKCWNYSFHIEMFDFFESVAKQTATFIRIGKIISNQYANYIHEISEPTHSLTCQAQLAYNSQTSVGIVTYNLVFVSFSYIYMRKTNCFKFHPSASLWCFNCYVLRNLNCFQVSILNVQQSVHFHNISNFFFIFYFQNQVMMKMSRRWKNSHFKSKSNMKWKWNKWLMIKSNRIRSWKSLKLIWIFYIPTILTHSLSMVDHFLIQITCHYSSEPRKRLTFGNTIPNCRGSVSL